MSIYSVLNYLTLSYPILIIQANKALKINTNTDIERVS